MKRNHCEQITIDETSFQEDSNFSQPIEKTRFKKNIFFLKAHKCGSSTIQNILLRFGYKNGLDFVLPAAGNYIGSPKPFTLSMIPPELRPETNKFNIFTHHTRFNEKETRKAMMPGALWVTILREPSDLFESLYSFYKLDYFFNASLKDLSYIYTMRPQVKNSRMNYRIGINQMSFDLGLRVDRFDMKDKVAAFIQKIDEAFDIVLISEYMEASLVLLAGEMGWPLENVVSMKLNARPDNMKNILEPNEKEAIRKLNYADTELYKYFLEKFKMKMWKYGHKKLLKDINRLIRLNNDLFINCILTPNLNGYAKTISYSPMNTGNSTCMYIAHNELNFTEEVRSKQMERLKTFRNLQMFLSSQL